MNNSGEHKRFHFTYKESIPAQFVKLWDAPARGFTNGSKVMIPAIRIGLEVNLALRKSPRKELRKQLFVWSARFAIGLSKLSTRRDKGTFYIPSSFLGRPPWS